MVLLARGNHVREDDANPSRGILQHRRTTGCHEQALILDPFHLGEVALELPCVGRPLRFNRAQALHKHRDILLHETIDFPQPDPDDPVDELGIKGLTCLYNMFGAVDDRFSETWTSLRSATRVAWPQNTATWLAGLQQQLTEAVPLDLKCTKIQEADLRVTQQWLRLVVWQLSTASGCLSSAAHDESMTLLYPIKLSKELAETLQYIEVSAMDVHGIGLVIMLCCLLRESR